MNRGLAIIVVPALLVALGYVLVLREIGIAPEYGRLAAVAGAFLIGLCWIDRRTRSKSRSANSG